MRRDYTGVVGVIRKEKCITAFVPVPDLTVDTLLRLGALIETVNLNEHDVTIRFDRGVPMLTVDFDASVTELQATLGIKALIDCLKRSGASAHPMLSYIHPQVARAHPPWLH